MIKHPTRRGFYHLATELMLDAIMDADTYDADYAEEDQISQYPLDVLGCGGPRDAG